MTNGKQYIQVTNDSKSDLRMTECGLVYVNDLPFSSKILNSIIFADDTNLFYEHKNIVKLLVTVNEESMNINDWFIANKLSLSFSLNVGKTKCSSFHKPSRVDDLPLQLPKLNVDNQEIKRASYTKSPGLLWMKIFHGKNI